MICRNCYRRIVQRDFEERCRDGVHNLVDFNKWWDDQSRCQGIWNAGGWHYHQVGNEWMSFGPHEPHTAAGRRIYPIYITELGEQVLGDREWHGELAYKDMWPHLTKRLIVCL